MTTNGATQPNQTVCLHCKAPIFCNNNTWRHSGNGYEFCSGLKAMPTVVQPNQTRWVDPDDAAVCECGDERGYHDAACHVCHNCEKFRPVARPNQNGEMTCTDPECFGDCHPIRKPSPTFAYSPDTPMATDKARLFPEQDERVETGAIQFGSDWPGVFIRGDNALSWAFFVEQAEKHPIYFRNLRALVRTLRKCDARNGCYNEPAAPPADKPTFAYELSMYLTRNGQQGTAPEMQAKIEKFLGDKKGSR